MNAINRWNKIAFFDLSLFILVWSIMGCGAQNTKSELNNEDYVVLNLFLEKFDEYAYLDLTIENIYDTSLVESYNRKLKLYNSLRSLCHKKISEKKELTYEINSICLTADTFKVYENLFTKNEIKDFEKQLKNETMNYNIDFKNIEVEKIKPLLNKGLKRVSHPLFFSVKFQV